MAVEEASVSARVGALAKSVGQPCAGKPHARLEEGAPVGQPSDDTQAPSTERDGNCYGLAKASSDRALLYTHSPSSTQPPAALVLSMSILGSFVDMLEKSRVTRIATPTRESDLVLYMTEKSLLPRQTERGDASMMFLAS